MTTHPFSETEPEVAVIPRPDAKLAEILRVDAGSFFVPLEVGAETMWAFYDWPERQLTGISHTRVAGTLRAAGEDCLEVIDRDVLDEEDRSWMRWLYVVSEETLKIIHREWHDGKGSGKLDEVDATPEPLRLKVGQAWEGHEIYRCGPEERGVGELHHALVDGPWEVVLPAGTMLCLRETRWEFGADQRGLILAELYVAESGRTVYFRRFNGPAYHNYQQLAGNPHREYDGVRWHLWYECLPDIAMEPASKPD